MELRCPDCCSPEVFTDPRKSPGAQRCGNCGAQFHRDSALVAVRDAESDPSEESPMSQPVFGFERTRAEMALRDPEGRIKPIAPRSDADELNGLFESALGAEIITCEFESAYIAVYPMSMANPEPLLAVELGGGVVILGPAIYLEQSSSKEPVAYTLRFLTETLGKANELSARFGQAERRLDRIAEFMTRNRPWSSADVCDFVDMELRASGRSIPNYGE